MIDELTQRMYMHLFEENPKELVYSLSKLQNYIKTIKDKKSILRFSDWANLSNIDYDDGWFTSLLDDILLRALEFDLLESTIVLSKMSDFLEDEHNFYAALRLVIKNNSFNSLNFLISEYLCHPDSEILPGLTLYSMSLSMQNKLVCKRLI